MNWFIQYVKNAMTDITGCVTPDWLAWAAIVFAILYVVCAVFTFAFFFAWDKPHRYVGRFAVIAWAKWLTCFGILSVFFPIGICVFYATLKFYERFEERAVERKVERTRRNRI